MFRDDNKLNLNQWREREVCKTTIFEFQNVCKRRKKCKYRTGFRRHFVTKNNILEIQAVFQKPSSWFIGQSVEQGIVLFWLCFALFS